MRHVRRVVRVLLFLSATCCPDPINFLSVKLSILVLFTFSCEIFDISPNNRRRTSRATRNKMSSAIEKWSVGIAKDRRSHHVMMSVIRTPGVECHSCLFTYHCQQRIAQRPEVDMKFASYCIQKFRKHNCMLDKKQGVH